MKTPADLLTERTQRVLDAYALRAPDRVPLAMNFGYMLARLGGITNQELESNHEKAQELLEKYALYYEPDITGGAGFGFPPQPSVTLGDRQTKWPGYGLDPNAPFQFIEGEYMKEGEYDAFLNDPSDFALRVFCRGRLANWRGWGSCRVCRSCCLVIRRSRMFAPLAHRP